jgi:hypothetical protein
VAANAIDLTTAATVAADLGVASSARIEALVTAASRAIARHCNRTFEKNAEITEYPASYGRPLLWLSRTPINSVASIEVFGAELEAAEFEVYDAEAGLVYRKNGQVWPKTVRSNGRISLTDDQFIGEAGDDGVTVVYSGGWVTPGQVVLSLLTPATLPEDVQEAAIITACALYKARGRDTDVSSEAIGDWSVSYFDRAESTSAIPPAAKALLAPYVRYTL